METIYVIQYRITTPSPTLVVSVMHLFVCAAVQSMVQLEQFINPHQAIGLPPTLPLELRYYLLQLALHLIFFYQDLLKSLPATKKKKKAFAAMQSTS
jgi:hypothetical protein